MPAITLTRANRAAVHALLTDQVWSVVCLCAAWCDVCTDFRSGFNLLAARHPDKILLWIDIEDEADVVGDFDVDNFPTLLVQRGDYVAFYGTIEADEAIAHRLIAAQARDGNGAPTAQACAPAHPHDLRRKLGASL